MAWRLSRYQTFVANTTVIGAAFLNAVQDAITYLFLGSKTVKQMQADGTGDGTPDATLAAGDIMAKCFRADGDADDEAAIKTQVTAAADWKLLWQIRLDASIYCRLYSGDGGFVIVTNAVWNLSTTKWDQEAAGSASACLMMLKGSYTWFGWKPAGSASWGSYSWDSFGHAISLGLARLNDTISSATAGAGQAVPAGYVYKDTTILAWAKVASNGTLTRGANIKSCTRVGAGEYAIEIQEKPANMTGATSTLNDVATSRGSIYTLPDNGGVGLITVYTDSSAGAPEDHSFTLTVVGG